MPSQVIKAVVFDLGNVLIDFDHMIAVHKITGYTIKPPQEIYRLFFDSELTKLFEAGRITPQEFFTRLERMLGIRISYEEFLPVWNEIFFLTAKNRQVYALAQSLRTSYRVCLLSNINILHYEYLKTNFDIFWPFERIFTSFEMGTRKPEPLIYQKVIQSLKLKPEEIFYTDDRAELAEAAREMGLVSFVFTDVERLRRDLTNSGIRTG